MPMKQTLDSNDMTKLGLQNWQLRKDGHRASETCAGLSMLANHSCLQYLSNELVCLA